MASLSLFSRIHETDRTFPTQSFDISTSYLRALTTISSSMRTPSMIHPLVSPLIAAELTTNEGELWNCMIG